MSSTDDNHDSNVTRHDGLRIPVDGETLAATRFEPVGSPSPNPVIVTASPYRKDDRVTFGVELPMYRYFAAHGYEFVVIDVGGTGASSGTREKAFSDGGDELATAIEWLADRDWATRDIGMYGLSYGGLTQLQAAAKQPEPLKAIIPLGIWNSAYESTYTGGALDLYRRGHWGTWMQVMQTLPSAYRDPDDNWRNVWKDRLEYYSSNQPWLFDWLEHPQKDEYWADQDVPIENIDTPTFLVCGYRDIPALMMSNYFEKIDAPKRFLFGPWRHVLPQYGRESAINFPKQALEWYDYFLRDIDNSALDHEQFEFFTERNGGWTKDSGVWRESKQWPRPTEEGSLTFALTSGGLIPAEKFKEGSVTRHYEYDHTVGIYSEERPSHTSLINDGIDTTPDDIRSVTFESERLSSPVEFTGNANASVRLRATTSEPTLAVRITDVDPEGVARPVTFGYLNCAHRSAETTAVSKKSSTTPSPLEPNEEYEITVPLQPRSHVFEPDHKIRVALSAAHFPRTFPPEEHGSFTFLSTPDEPSTITLPGTVHEKCAEFSNRIEMPPPDDDLPLESEWVIDRDADWLIGRRPPNDAVEVDQSDEFAMETPHGADLRFTHDTEHFVQADEPRSAVYRNVVVGTIDYGTEVIRSKATSRISRDVALMTNRVTLDGEPVFEETWRL